MAIASDGVTRTGTTDARTISAIRKIAVTETTGTMAEDVNLNSTMDAANHTSIIVEIQLLMEGGSRIMIRDDRITLAEAEETIISDLII